MQNLEQECYCKNCREASKSQAIQRESENYSFVDKKYQDLQNLCRAIKREGICSAEKPTNKSISLDRLADSVNKDPNGIISLCWLGRHRNVLDFSDEDLTNQGEKCKIYLVSENCSTKFGKSQTQDENIASEEINFAKVDFDFGNCCCSTSQQYSCPITNDSFNIHCSNNEILKPLTPSSRLQFESNHLIDELLSLCETIDAFGYEVSDEPDMKAITYGELYELYLFKHVEQEKMDLASICYLARQYCLIQFEGDCLSIPKDEELALFLIQTIEEIKKILDSDNSGSSSNKQDFVEKENGFDKLDEEHFKTDILDVIEKQEQNSCQIDDIHFQQVSERSNNIENHIENELGQSESLKRFEELNNYCKSAYQCASSLLDNQSLHIVITCQNKEKDECDFIVGENKIKNGCSDNDKNTKSKKDFKCEFSQTDETSYETDYCQTELEVVSNPCCFCCRRSKTLNHSNDFKVPITKLYPIPPTRKNCQQFEGANKKIDPTRNARKENLICRCSKLEISVSQHRPKHHGKEIINSDKKSTQVKKTNPSQKSNFQKEGKIKDFAQNRKEAIQNNMSPLSQKIVSSRERTNSRLQNNSNKLSSTCVGDVRKHGGNSRSHSQNRLNSSQNFEYVMKPSKSKLSTSKKELAKDTTKTSKVSSEKTQKRKCGQDTSIIKHEENTKLSKQSRLRSGCSSKELILRIMPHTNSRSNNIFNTMGNVQNIAQKCISPNVFIYPRLKTSEDFILKNFNL